jgi:hypothetical protein
MKRSTLILIAFIAFYGCSKKKYFEGPDFFQDGFESANELNDLLIDDDLYWSYTQLTSADNSITIDSSMSHSGQKSLKFMATASNKDLVSKSSIAKQKMAFWEGETVRLTAWYYIAGTQSLDWLFLMDIEEQATIGAGPGMRLALVDNKLRMEYKFNERDIIQSEGEEIDFPRNQWVEVIWELTLSRKDKGSVRLWQNGQKLIDRSDVRTLPKDLLYFQQGTKGMYSSCEIGITANSRENNLTLWVDDIRFEKVN